MAAEPVDVELDSDIGVEIDSDVGKPITWLFEPSAGSASTIESVFKPYGEIKIDVSLQEKAVTPS